jgi:DNA sulfur modification protein DndD
MKISHLHLCNFKGFKELHKIDSLDKNLSDSQNVILIGGLNGAGKTTFLEALFLCFYGVNANKLYPSRGAKSENYNSFLAALLNNEIKSAGNINAEMYIEVFLKDVELAANFTRDISLKRSWEFTFRNDEMKHEESFVILENGKPIDEIDPSEYEDKIQSLLPYNVSQFFFFDGEKIQDFASDTDNEFANSLKDVLGINLYTTLADDIKQVRSRILNEYNKNKDSSIKVKDKEKEIEEQNKLIDDNRMEITELNEVIAKLDEDSEKIKAETKRATRISANSRENYQAEKEKLINEKEYLEKQYVEQSKDYLPFILTYSLCTEIEEQLFTEEKIKGLQAAQKEVEPKIDGIVEAIFQGEPQEVKLKPPQKKYYQYKIDEVIRKFLLDGKNVEIDESELIHNLSEPDAKKLKSFIKELREINITLLHSKADRLKQIDIALDRIRQTESRSGSNSNEVQNLFDKINDLATEIGRKKQKVDDLIHQNREAEKLIGSIEGELKKIQNTAELNKKHKKQVEYCERMQLVIKDFQKQYQAKRTHELETSIKEMWNKLSHKEKFVKNIRVLPDSNFEVKLYDNFESEIDKTKMSAGEREIYAIALLWALVQVSGKKLPIVVDTPFGRLDSIHRKNLLENYFPQASHQVILLSQDEEIVNEYYKIIKPCIAREYTFENKGNQTIVKDGYPFKPKK